MWTATDIAAGAAAACVVGEALILVALLLADGPRRREHQWLAVALGGAAASSLEDVIEHFGLTRELAWALPFTGPGLLVVGPAMYLYARQITATNGATRPRAWVHFLPALAVLALSLFLVPLIKEAPPSPSRPAEGAIALAPVALQLAVYLLVIVRLVLRTRTRLKDTMSTLDGRTLSWLLVVAGLYGLVLVAWVGSWTASVAQSDLLTNVLMMFTLGITGAFGVRQRNVFAPRRVPAAAAEAHPTADDAASPVAVEMPAKPAIERVPERTTEARADAPSEAPAAKYARSAIDPALADRLRARLLELVAADKPYLEADLTLADLAGRIGTTPHQLSQLFSQHLGETFFDFINRHRVEAVKATLARPGTAARPLLEIALECGFGSKSTFNDTFRRLTGVSPSQFRRTLALPPSA